MKANHYHNRSFCSLYTYTSLVMLPIMDMSMDYGHAKHLTIQARAGTLQI